MKKEKRIIYENIEHPIEDDFLDEDYGVMRSRSRLAARMIVPKFPRGNELLVEVQLKDFNHPMKPGMPIKEPRQGLITGIITSFVGTDREKRRDPKRVTSMHMASQGKIDGVLAQKFFDHHSYGPVFYTRSTGWSFSTEGRGHGIPLDRVQRVTILPKNKR